jgi:c(7)-type cytochrome triheme protein
MSTPSRNRFRAALEPILSAAGLLLLLVAVMSASPAGSAGSPGTAAKVPLKLPPDRVYAGSVGPDSAVTFSHVTHVDYESSRCTGCHTKLFRILAPTTRITHREMNAGASCGACHDGKHAFDVRANESCVSCHAGRRGHAAVSADSAGAAPPAFSGPQPYAFKRGDASPGQVTFRHATHKNGGLRCTSCHPKLFAMKALVPNPNADMHAASACGGCHDGKQSFGVDDDNACARCHVEGKAGK